MQECAAQAERVLASEHAEDPEVGLTMANHWNRRMNRCFVRLDGVRINNRILVSTTQILDAFERREFVHRFKATGGPTGTSFSCSLSPLDQPSTTEPSEEICDSKILSYMEEWVRPDVRPKL
jgi:hypothetical protein